MGVRARSRVIVTIVAVVVLLAASFLAYGWWTRRGPVQFGRGGPFASPSPTPLPDDLPPAGRYVFEASGEERVKLGAISACDWPVDEIEMTIARDGADTIVDQQIGERLERLIHRDGADGIRLQYSASTVTCLGIRTTSEDTYESPPLRFRLPLRPGDTWTTTATSEHRTEEATIRVLRREQVTVPAGSFDAFVVELRARFSGEQQGTIEQVSWFAPALRLWVRQESSTQADRSGARFTSTYTAELASLPAPLPSARSEPSAAA